MAMTYFCHKRMKLMLFKYKRFNIVELYSSLFSRCQENVNISCNFACQAQIKLVMYSCIGSEVPEVFRSVFYPEGVHYYSPGQRPGDEATTPRPPPPRRGIPLLGGGEVIPFLSLSALHARFRQYIVEWRDP